MNDNILISFLSLCGVKHTKTFTRKFFNEHPHKYNLFGLSTMLSVYGIENAGVKICDKNQIAFLEPPFIVHTGNDFAVVNGVDKDEISYIQRDGTIKIKLDNFFEIWTGYTLIAEPDDNSIEPNFRKHQKLELFGKLRNSVIIAITTYWLIFAFITNSGYLYPGIVTLFITSLIGVYICCVIILKQLKVQSNYADKLCSLLKHSDCNNIIESDASKLFDTISLSDIGMGYFLSNLTIISLLPSFIPHLLFINIFCLPFSIWSVWYQRFKAKQWCVLCLIVLALFWAIFISGISFKIIDISAIKLLSIIILGSIYLAFILIINLLMPIITKSRNSENTTYEINSIKADEYIFEMQLKKQPRYEVSKNSSKILLGNTNSNFLITIFTNPHCNPCAKMHQRVHQLLEQNKQICVQYIFSSFNESLDISNKYLIAAYLQKKEEHKSLYDRWFKGGKFYKEEFFRQNPVDINMNDVIEEFFVHEQWKEKSGLRATPTILINGYALPDYYKIEDLKYFIAL